MYLFVLSIFALVPLLSVVLYQHNGKKQIFQLDVVQFIYLYVFMPIIFVLAKSILFYVLKNDLNNGLSQQQIFIIDTIFSIVGLYIVSAFSIHTLTKTFWLRKNRDPDFDIFHLSEYFHLWWSHIAMFLGFMLGLSFLSTINVWIPLELHSSVFTFYLSLFAGVIVGILGFMGMWWSDPKQERRRFLRLMKLCLMVFSIYHGVLYFLMEPKFSIQYVLFWTITTAFVSGTISGVSFVRSSKAKRFHQKMLHSGWGNNIQVFAEKQGFNKEK